MVVSRFDVLLIKLDPTVGHEIKKTRPCVVISPDEINHSHSGVLLVAPLTSTSRALPTRVPTHCEGKDGEIALEQIRSIDRQRIIKKISSLDGQTCQKLLQTLQALFS